MSLREPKERLTSEEAANKPQDTHVQHFSVRDKMSFQFLRYCLVGGVNTIIDVSILNIFLWRFPTHTIQVLIAYNSVAYCSGAISSFFLNKYWTFRRMHRLTASELIRFVCSVVLEMLYSNVLVWLAGKVLQPFITNITLWGNAAKLVAVVCGTVLSYSLMRCWTFAYRPTDRDRDQTKKPS